MNSILITGCNRGIGFGLVKYLSENRNLKYIFATCRQPNEAKVMIIFIQLQIFFFQYKADEILSKSSIKN